MTAIRVMLAADGSDPAMRACRTVASLLVPGRDHVLVLTVLSYSLYPHSLTERPLSDEELLAIREDEEVRRLTDEPRAVFEMIGVDVEVTHRFGNPTDEIVAQIGEWSPDLVVLGRRGVRGVQRWVGSVSEHVLHHAKVPLLLVP